MKIELQYLSSYDQKNIVRRNVDHRNNDHSKIGKMKTKVRLIIPGNVSNPIPTHHLEKRLVCRGFFEKKRGDSFFSKEIRGRRLFTTSVKTVNEAKK